MEALAWLLFAAGIVSVGRGAFSRRPAHFTFAALLLIGGLAVEWAESGMTVGAFLTPRLTNQPRDGLPMVPMLALVICAPLLIFLAGTGADWLRRVPKLADAQDLELDVRRYQHRVKKRARTALVPTARDMEALDWTKEALASLSQGCSGAELTRIAQRLDELTRARRPRRLITGPGTPPTMVVLKGSQLGSPQDRVQ